MEIYIFSIFTIWILAVIMPGPDMFLVIKTAVNSGRISGIGASVGIVAGTVVWLIVGKFFINVLNSSGALNVIKICGGLYLCYVGVNIALGLFNKSKKPSLNSSVLSPKMAFFRGLFTNLSNPKAPIFVSSTLMLLPVDSSLYVVILVLVMMSAIPLAWFTFVSFVLTMPRFLEIFLRYSKVIDLIAVVVFVIFGATLLIESFSAI